MSGGGSARQARCLERIHDRWPGFQATRRTHLASHAVGLTVPERIAENILFELFTDVLDWQRSDVRWQQDRVDLLLTRLGVKQLVVEAKRPGSFDGPGSIQRAMRQARGYAEELGVDKIAVSDGCVLVAEDLVPGASMSRLRVHLADVDPPDDLWWISTRGIYRSPDPVPAATSDVDDHQLRHPRYGLPSRCFAYVGRPDKPATWKLPYLCADGSVDARRLPKAVQAVLRDYRGEQVRLPEGSVPQVLGRLAAAARHEGRMPDQDATPADVYVALQHALDQLARL